LFERNNLVFFKEIKKPETDERLHKWIMLQLPFFNSTRFPGNAGRSPVLSHNRKPLTQ
jgi:hypothetical protein